MSTHNAHDSASDALQEAQERLFVLRAQLKNSRDQAPSSARNSDWRMAIDELPPHLGWNSRPLTTALRSTQCSPQRYSQGGQTSDLDRLPGAELSGAPHPFAGFASNQDLTKTQPGADSAPGRAAARMPDAATVKIHPSIGHGMLRAKKSASGRVWLLLRFLDHSGRGWMSLEETKRFLCEPESSWHLCGARQLRYLLAQGEGIFWQRANGRLWLRSIPGVARALEVTRLQGRPVALPVRTLLQSIGRVRAHLFATFHSGRQKSSPISRSTLERLSRVCPRSQQDYERRAGVRKQFNYTVAMSLGDEKAQELAWQKGSASFRWRSIDAKRNGQKQSYLAWQLPNSYIGPHKQRPLGRKKRFNRQLADLFATGITGNDQMPPESKLRRYFEAAKPAAMAQHHSQTAVYWRGQRAGLWHYLEPQDI